MLDFSLTSEQEDFVRSVRDFCEKETNDEKLPALTDDWKTHHNWDIYKKMADLGWIGLTIPEELGGSGGDFLDACLFMEQTAYGQAPIGGYGTTIIVIQPILKYGTDEQKKILTETAKGGVLAIAMTEPESGSDVASVRTSAKKTDAGWVMNGQKVFISNAHLASHIVVLARTNPDVGKHDGLTLFIVPKDTPGMTMNPISTMGGEETNTLFFEDMELPDSAVLGEVDQGWTALINGLNGERLFLAAGMTGIAQRSFDDALAYVKERKQFGRPIGSFQVLQHRFADLATEIEVTRLLVRYVAWQSKQEGFFHREASMAKLKATEVAKRVTLEGIQFLGGYGYSTEYPMERYFRSAVVSTIYGGTNEIQRGIIAKTLGL